MEGSFGITSSNVSSPNTWTTYTIQNHSYLPVNTLINGMSIPSISYVNTIPPLNVFPHSVFNFLMFLMDTSHRSHQILFTSMVQRHKDSPTSLLSLSFTFFRNACHLSLSVQLFLQNINSFSFSFSSAVIESFLHYIYLLQNLLCNQDFS